MNTLGQRVARHLALACMALGGLMACAGEVEGEDLGEAQGELGDDCDPGDATPCETGDGLEGVSICYEADDGLTYWDECSVSSSIASTPLVLSFDASPVRYVTSMAGAFDLTGNGMSVATDWPTAHTPWLAMDRDGDGRITSGAELFGSATLLADGTRADNGFSALRELDDNGDGRITSADAAWSHLLLWSDGDASRTSDGSELSALEQHGIVSIDVDYSVDRRCTTRNNCEIERARFTFRTQSGGTSTGAVVDIHLAHH